MPITDQLEGAATSNAGSESTSPQVAATGQLNAPEIQKKRAGPRTQLGKERTKYNAVKHGLFAKVVLLSHEPRSEFNALLYGLRESLKPEGVLELTLVEKLATIFWRYRRLLQAESAEVLRNFEERRHEAEERSARQEELRWRRLEDLAKHSQVGLIEQINDAKTLETCLGQLRIARNGAQYYGLGFEEDDFDQSFCLALVYGIRYQGRPGKDLYDCFLECRDALKTTPVEREKRGFSSEDACLNKFVDEAGKEILRLTRLQESLPRNSAIAIKSPEEVIGLLKSSIPTSYELGHLLRYEVSVERAFDRTLAQLERLQRIRFDRETIDIVRPLIPGEKSLINKPQDL
jgi:hypothetical protein